MASLLRLRLRFCRRAFPIAFSASLIALAISAQSASSAHGLPVLVELFTSEGCSSCPPADALLARLDSTQFVQGAQAIVLSEHVTYWDHLGWRDPYSLEAMTQRQEHYVRAFGESTAYTPEIVVDGAVGFVGSDASSLKRAIANAIHTAKSELFIEQAQWVGNKVQFIVRSAAAPGEHLTAFLAEDSVESPVNRGENAGHILRHVAVVRALQQINGNFLDDRPVEIAVPHGLATGKKATLHLVVIRADSNSGRVSGVAAWKAAHPRPDTVN